MKNTFRTILLAVTLFALLTAGIAPFVPVTGASTPSTYSINNSQSAATTSVVSKLEISGILANEVVQQPKGSAGFVSTDADKLTQFALATKYGSKGFLAHNNLAGSTFSNVTVGSLINVTYADGTSETFQVQAIRKFQALNPTSPTSKFVDLDTNAKLTATELFMQTYGVKGTLVMQTCIAKGSEASWGRLFIIATPYTLGVN